MKHILVIDDDEDIRDVARVALEVVGGWKVSIACSGFEGLKIAETQQPDAILLDVMMPEMNGVETFEKLQANKVTQQIPVILLTAKVQYSDRQRFSELSVAGTIPKPFKTMTLADLVAEILDWDE
jgi:CheY-like chemotaxis protein